MYELQVKIKGINELIKKLGVARADLDPVIISTTTRVGKHALTVLRSNTPVDTGNLKDSMTLELKGKSFVLGPNEEQAPYAKFVEFGHHSRAGNWIPGKWFTKKTLTQIKPYNAEQFQKAIMSWIRKHFG
jgi:HK97 gp10 family phage protein